MASIVVQFKDTENNSTGPSLNVPIDTNCEQLNLLLNKLLENEEQTPYSFVVGSVEIQHSIQSDLLVKNIASSEDLLQITYFPQSIFRVKPASRCTSTLSGHQKEILTASFSPNGLLLATGSGDSSVRFWDVSTETAIETGSGHRNWVLVVAWSPCGRFLASGSMDSQVILWTSSTGEGKQEGRSLLGHTKFITCLAWEPLHLATDACRLASASKDGAIRVWNVIHRNCAQIFANHTDAVTCLKWSGRGILFSGSRDRTIRMWDTNTGTMIKVLEGHAHWINTMSLSSEQVLRTGAFDHNGLIDGSSVLTCWEKAKEIALARYKSVGRERLVSGSDDFSMILWDPFGESGKKPVSRMTGHQGLVNSVAFSPEGLGRWIASASFDKSIKLWNGTTGEFVATFRGHVSHVYQISFSPDSRFLVSGSKDSTVKVWNIRTRALHSDLPGHQDEVYAVDWAPTGDHIASGGKDRNLKIWRH